MAALNHQIMLPLFWADKAARRFVHKEVLYWSKNIFEEWDHTALDKELILLSFAAGTQPDKEVLYTRLKEDLLQ
jgi:hypothetical protein